MKLFVLAFLVATSAWAASPFTELLFLQRTYDGRDFTIPISALEKLQDHMTGVAIHQGQGSSLNDPRELDSHELMTVVAFDDGSFLLLRFKNLPLLQIAALYETVHRSPEDVTFLLNPKPVISLLTSGGRIHTESLEGFSPPGGILRAWF